MVLGLLFLLLLLVGGSGEGRTITVDDDGGADYISIQDAINASEDGDTIRVWDGIYREDIIVNVSVSLIGNGTNKTIFEHLTNTTNIIILSDNVTIKGFSFTGLWNNDWEPPSFAWTTTGRGIQLTGDYCRISSNRFLNLDWGIWQVKSNWSIIENCQFVGGYYGVSVDEPSQFTFINNSFSQYITGVTLSTSDGNSISNCTFKNNKMGLRLQRSSNNVITHNNFSFNTGHAIFIDDGSPYNSIVNNTFLHNDIGIRFGVNSPHCSVHYNEITGNRIGISVLDKHLSGIVDARFNWWGNASGPYHSEKNKNGGGDRIGDNVTFKPWLLSDFSVNIMESKEDEDTPAYVPFIVSGIIGLSFLGLLGTFYLREDLRFLLLSLLTAPLYTKLEKNDILDQPKRQNIYSYIVNKPGSNLTRLHKELPIGYGTIVHHLKVLEREKHIRSKKQMGRKLFFPTGTDWVAQKNKVAAADAKPDTGGAVGGGGEEQIAGNGNQGTDGNRSGAIQSGGNGDPSTRVGGGLDSLENLSSVPMGLLIIDYLKESGPATQVQMKEVLGISHAAVSYNLTKLVEEGRVEKSDEKRGAMYILLDDQ